MKRVKKLIAVITAGILSLLGVSCSISNSGSDSSAENKKWEYLIEGVTEVKNVILMIGDGMGPEQIKAGEIYKGESLVMQQFPYKVRVNTDSLSGTTDSSAAATAMATGRSILNGCVGLDANAYLEDDPTAEMETIIDIASAMGKRTGVLTTEVLYGATPMGFSAHNFFRDHSLELLESAAKNSNVNLFASETINKDYYQYFTKNGYTEIPSVSDISTATQDKIFGTYNIKASAESMTAIVDVAFDYLITEALDYLSQDEDGFFLMAEGAHIDHGGHNNDMRYMLEELLAFDDAIKAVLEWTKGRTDTVVIVTADHECGSLMLGPEVTHENILEEKNGKPVNYMWGSTGHSATEVFCFINGVDLDFSQYSRRSKNAIKNTDIFEIVYDLLHNTINV